VEGVGARGVVSELTAAAVKECGSAKGGSGSASGWLPIMPLNGHFYE